MKFLCGQFGFMHSFPSSSESRLYHLSSRNQNIYKILSSHLSDKDKLISLKMILLKVPSALYKESNLLCWQEGQTAVNSFIHFQCLLPQKQKYEKISHLKILAHCVTGFTYIHTDSRNFTRSTVYLQSQSQYPVPW